MLHKPIVIGFLGACASGKTTAARYLQSNYGAKITAFAEPLKLIAQDCWDFTEQQVAGTQADKVAIDPRYGKSPRAIMQQLGQSLRNRVHEDIWVDRAFKFILDDSVAFGSTLYAIDDVRYKSEAEKIATSKDFHGVVVKLICPDSDKLPEALALHTSEQEIDKVPESLILRTIVSSKSHQALDLKHKINDLMEELYRKGLGF